MLAAATLTAIAVTAPPALAAPRPQAASTVVATRDGRSQDFAATANQARAAKRVAQRTATAAARASANANVRAKKAERAQARAHTKARAARAAAVHGAAVTGAKRAKLAERVAVEKAAAAARADQRAHLATNAARQAKARASRLAKTAAKAARQATRLGRAAVAAATGKAKVKAARRAVSATPEIKATFVPAQPLDGNHGRRVVYDKALMTVWLVNAKDEVVARFPVVGRPDRPAAGTYRVYSQSKHAVNLDQRLLFDYMTRFAHGTLNAATPIGFHTIPRAYDGTPMHGLDKLGLPLGAGGCVRLARSAAKQIYEFAHVGTQVVVLGAA